MQIVSRIIKMDKNVPYLKVNSPPQKKTQKNALGDKVVVLFFSS